MTGPELEDARAQIGRLWGLPGPLPAADFARLLYIDRRDPGAVVREWETGQRLGGQVPGYARAFAEALLAGYRPPGAPIGAAPMGAVLPPNSQGGRRRNP